MEAKPLPAIGIAVSLWTMVMLGQFSRCGVRYWYSASSSARRNSSARSENTTPKPQVASRGLRSKIAMSCDGSRRFISAAKYKPAGPAPRIRIFIVQSAASRVERDLGARRHIGR